MSDTTPFWMYPNMDFVRPQLVLVRGTLSYSLLIKVQLHTSMPFVICEELFCCVT
jgi:hypothetical protein